jgi:glutathione synthase/RimK-type ligase-like ATP-grasp enzyme
LVQNYIEKKYELRIFFLGGQFYSVAIFSQQDEKTKLDFRNYNDERPNRIVSYKLPESVEVKLKNLVCLIKMDSGSIDLIVTKENDYIFLEINHVGQFLWTSDSCNLNFDEKVAIHLINLSKNKL